MPLMRLLRALYSILIRCRLDVNLEVDFSVVSTTNESKSLNYSFFQIYLHNSEKSCTFALAKFEQMRK